MCGIAGTVNFQTKPEKKKVLEMLKTISYRGPNSTGFHISKNVILGVNRLSVIDLKTGNQPISNEKNTVTVVYNGEIYNFEALRSELQNKSHKFKTQTDTEVLVHLYEEYGPYFPKMLSGMFAFALWDKKKKVLILGRDQIGIKPFFYTLKKGVLSFSSELKSLLKDTSIKKDLDEIAVRTYLALGYIPGDKSIIRGVKKLLPGQVLIFSKSGYSIKTYWNPKFLQRTKNLHNLDNLLGKSIESQTISDVPWGVFLSGGLDSSLIVHYLAKQHKKIKTFCLKFEDSRFDESKYAKVIAKLCKTDHKEIPYSVKDLLKEFKFIVQRLDEPLSDPSLFPTYHLAKATSKDVTVVLSGDGGDELFGGYPSFQGDLFANHLKKFPRNLTSVLRMSKKLFPISFGTYSSSETLDLFFDSLHLPDNIRRLEWVSRLGINKSWKQISNNGWFSRFLAIKDYRWLLLKTYLPDDLLVKTDRATMLNSLEARVPLLDLELVDYAFSTSNHYDHFQLKKQLRSLAKKNLPDEIVNRKKKGFGIPLSVWSKTSLKPLIESFLKKDILFQYVEKKDINNIWQDHLSGKKDYSRYIWTVVILSAWLDSLFDSQH